MAAMPLLCIIQGTACLRLQGMKLPQNKSALPTAPSPLLSALGFDAACVHLGLLALPPDSVGWEYPQSLPALLACRAHRAVTGIKQRKGWIRDLFATASRDAEPAGVMSMSHFLLAEPAKYLVSGFC